MTMCNLAFIPGHFTEFPSHQLGCALGLVAIHPVGRPQLGHIFHLSITEFAIHIFCYHQKLGLWHTCYHTTPKAISEHARDYLSRRRGGSSAHQPQGARCARVFVYYSRVSSDTESHKDCLHCHCACSFVGSWRNCPRYPQYCR